MNTDKKRPKAAVTIKVDEPAEIPLLSRVLGYGPMLPYVGGAAAVWVAPAGWAPVFETLTLLWAGSILLFLAGVRRGLSFRTMGGPSAAQIVTMTALFSLGGISLTAVVYGRAWLAVVLQIIGCAVVAIFDPIAAQHGEVPVFFASLRPPQQTIAIAGLVAVGVHQWMVR